MFLSKNLITYAKNNLKGKYFKYFIMMFFLALVSFITIPFTKYSSIEFIKALFNIIVGAIISGYICGTDLNIAKGKDDIFPNTKEFLARTLKTIRLVLITVIVVHVGFRFFIIPGVYASIYFSQAIYIHIEDNTRGIINCLEESLRLMKGNAWNYILLNIRFIPYILLSFITFGIYAFWAVPIIQVSLASFYLGLKEAN